MKEVVPGKVLSEEDSSAEYDLLVTVKGKIMKSWKIGSQ